MAKIHHEPEAVLRYRRRVGRGAIMRPSTFEAIQRKARRQYGPIGAERLRKIAGAAYWTTADARERRARARRRRARHLHSR
jgi:hypothetical protein